jgi:transcriptional regulator with XRE-family HTH domain
LADKAGVGYATVARFETGQTIANDSRDKLAKALADAGAQFSQKVGRIGVSVPE